MAIAEQTPGNANSSGYAPIPREEKIEGKLNADILQSIIMETEERGGVGFKIENSGQLWEIAKMMALSGPAVAHPLRGKPYLCFAVAQQAQRWRMDPFAVGSKAYVTKSKDRETEEIIERIAYEAQLVNAVINTNAPIKCRPSVKWGRAKESDPDSLTCTVSATFINEDEEKALTSPTLAGIHPKNSPLWKTAPQIQIAYWTLRAWARLYCPEVLLGVYTPDEMGAEADLIDTTGSPTPPRPTREGVAQIFRDQLRGPDPSDTPHDPETGEVIEDTATTESATGSPEPEAETPAAGATTENSAEPSPDRSAPTSTGAPAAEPTQPNRNPDDNLFNDKREKPKAEASKPPPQAAEPQQPKQTPPPAQAKPVAPSSTIPMEAEDTSEAVYRNLLKLLGICAATKAVANLVNTEKRVARLKNEDGELYEIFMGRVEERKKKLAKEGK